MDASAARYPLISLNIGEPGTIVCENGSKVFQSGILRKAVTGRYFLDALGFRGDGVADTVNHGGADKAVCGYCHDHYDVWQSRLGREMRIPSFGENLTIGGLRENLVRIGDVYRLGEAEIQCTQPRQPCWKLNSVYAMDDFAAQVRDTGFTGYYFRVLKPGWVEHPGAELVLLSSGPEHLSVQSANEVMHGPNRFDAIKLKALIAFPALSGSWRASFVKRLDSLSES